MSIAAKFLKTSSVYMLGNALTKLVGFFLIPLYTAYLLPEEFGYFNLASTIVLVAVPFFGMEVWTGLLRFLLDTGKADDRLKFANAGFYIALASTAVLTAVFVAVGILFDVALLGYIYFYCIAQGFRFIYESFARGFGSSVLFAVSGIVSSLVTIGLNIILIVHLNFGVKALFLSAGFGYVAQILVIEAKVHALRYLSPKYLSRQALAEMVRFSAPLSLGTICYWFSTGYSAIAISRTQGLAENGMYTVAGKFVGVLLLFTQVFTLASQEILYKADEGKQELYNTSMNYYFKFLSVSTLTLIVLTKAVYPFMVNEAFAESLRFIPLYFLASFVNYFAIYLGNYFLKEKKTGQNALSLLVPGVINVVVIHLLIDSIGAYAAAAGLLLGYTASVVMRLIQLRSFTQMRFDYRYFICFIGLTGATLLVFFHLGEIWNFIWACVLGLTLLWLFRQYIGPVLAMIKRRGEGKRQA